MAVCLGWSLCPYYDYNGTTIDVVRYDCLHTLHRPPGIYHGNNGTNQITNIMGMLEKYKPIYFAHLTLLGGLFGGPKIDQGREFVLKLGNTGGQ